MKMRKREEANEHAVKYLNDVNYQLVITKLVCKCFFYATLDRHSHLPSRLHHQSYPASSSVSKLIDLVAEKHLE